MSCGCAKRMRQNVLPEAGYELRGKVWVNNKTGDRIPDSEVEKHHTRLVMMNSRLRKAAARAVTKKLLDLIDVKSN